VIAGASADVGARRPPSADRTPAPAAGGGRRATLGPLALYTALALLIWGPWLVRDPEGVLLAANDIDPSAYLWFFAWWPHALGEGLDPFVTSLIFVPEGYNLAWVASMPGPSLLLAPLTLAFGPGVTWNVVSLASPALSGWTAYLLCRHVTAGAIVPSLMGGWLFGFSPYMLGHLAGAPQLAFVALVPVFVLLAVRHAEGSLGDRPFVAGTAAALAAQALISTEVLATTVVFGGLALVVAYALYAERRRRLLRTAALEGVAGAIAAILVSPLLFATFFRPATRPEQALEAFPADVASFLVPAHWLALAQGHAPGETPAWATGFGYYGAPLLVLVALFAWSHRGSRVARLAVAAMAMAIVASLGRSLAVGGADTGIPLPWAIFAGLPLLQYAIPVRFSAFAFLPAAVIVALWLAWRPSAGRWALAIAVVVVLLPAVGNATWHTELPERAFFATDLHRRHLDERDRVLVIPAWGANMWWHTEADLSFRLVGGYVGAFPDGYTRFPIWGSLLGGELPADPERELRRFLAAKGATVVVLDPRQGRRWRPILEARGPRPVAAGGMLVYRLAPPPAG
jgi:hypothetical protein